MNEAAARIKINRLLERAGWRFFPEHGPEGGRPANICLEYGTPLQPAGLDAMGDDFQQTGRGVIDFLLLDGGGRPLAVLEAKAEAQSPLVGKEQARRYANSQNCLFVILSNGNLHYLWDLRRGDPHIITAFPTQESLAGQRRTQPDRRKLADEKVDQCYIAQTQRHGFEREAGYLNEAERPEFVETHKLSFLRPYQLQAIHALQRAAGGGSDRFLFEMATGTGKTLTAAAVIKLFLRTGNASRALFLVDRLELEDQALKAFQAYLLPDFTAVIYKQQRGDWRRAEIVISTVQSLLSSNKYQTLFSPTDFDLVISDEAHRSISGHARAVFDYFAGCKLGLTATPRDYLKGGSGPGKDARPADPREIEGRLLRDTYHTFGCGSGEPTFRYALTDGVNDGHLVNPVVIDARTEVTTQMLSDQGLAVSFTDEATGEEREETYKISEFERRFFSEATNRAFCQAFLEGARPDPVTGETGKSIIFAVSQHHAARLTQTLNELAAARFPGKYQSDFAVQVTSQVAGAQEMARDFANNNLLGHSRFNEELEAYRTSRARICVTVGMMTTGYDCPDLLNLGLFRPIFSPTEFVQIKGRGTRRHNFLKEFGNETPPELRETPAETFEKDGFKLFDFFAVYEFFEHEFDYHQQLELPRLRDAAAGTGPEASAAPAPLFGYEHLGPDAIQTVAEIPIGYGGMRVDRMLFQNFEDAAKRDARLRAAVADGRWDEALDYVTRELFDRPEEYYNLQKLRRAAGVDRRLPLREILEKIFGLIPAFLTKDELLEEEFGKFLAAHPPDETGGDIRPIKHYFKAYAADGELRGIIDAGEFQRLATYAAFSLRDWRAVPPAYRKLVPEYIKDYVSLNQFAP